MACKYQLLPISLCEYVHYLNIKGMLESDTKYKMQEQAVNLSEGKGASEGRGWCCG